MQNLPGIVAAGLVLATATKQASAENLEYSRTHLVDHYNVSAGITNFLFRSNFPRVNDTFARQELDQFMAKRAQEAGLSLPSEFFFLDISFDNPFEADYYLELDYFAKNPPNANLTEYLLVGALLPPEDTPADIRDYLVNNTDVLWAIDQLPERLSNVRRMLTTPHPSGLPLVMDMHCEAGCDRTGEFSGSYYMQYHGYNVSGAFARDTVECGRPPNNFSKGALGWYCLTLEKQGRSLGNCLDF